MNMELNETRINAALAELNWQIQQLTQRNINLAGDLAMALEEIKQLKEKPCDTSS